MQNKPNFRKSQMNVSVYIKREYVKNDTWSSGKNKANSKPIQSQYKANSNPIQTQFKPNTNPIVEKAKMNASKVLTRDYENKSHFCPPAKQTQSCPPSLWRDKSNPPAPKPGRFDCCPALEFSAFLTIGLMNSITKHLVLWIIESFLKIFGHPCVIVGKTGLIAHKEALSISRAKMGNRILFHIDKIRL